MKKTLTVNISGIVFHIDEDAYSKLERYLTSIRRHFNKNEGCDEIISGIEGRIAEMFQEKTKDHKQVVTLEDVSEVIRQLGEPEEISGDNTQEKDKQQPYEEPETVKGSKRLYRDPDNKYLGGVCGGMGAFFQIDPTWIRLLFILAIFAGFGILLYIILWIVIPKARSTADKLEMRGEKVNLSNIEKSIKEDLQDIKRNLQDLSEDTKDVFKKKKINREQNNALRMILEGIAAFIQAIFRFIGIILGVVLVFFGVVFLIALLTALFFGSLSFIAPFSHLLHPLSDMLEVVFTTQWHVYLASAGILLSIGIPLILIMLAGLQLVFRFDTSSRVAGFIFLLLWITGIVLLIVAALNGLIVFTGL
jgi:phage shock protein PspC (stress-responsive transcriptional regulator)